MAGRPYFRGPHPNNPYRPAPPVVPGWTPEELPPEQPKTIRIRNLATETSPDDLRRIFSQLGSVMDLWVVVDKWENPMGLAYCEFSDPQAVKIAVAHLNGVAFKGNPIHIEPVGSEWKEERARIMAEKERSRNATVAPQYSQPMEIPPEPQENTEDLANLNSEQMFNLMHQMKLCIEADPVEARNALLRNFTLSAGMLQALLMMKLVDPQEALDIIMKEEPQAVPPSQPTSSVPQPVAPVAAPPQTVHPPPHHAPVYNMPPPGPAIPMDPRQARGRQDHYPPPMGHPPPQYPYPRPFPPVGQPPPSQYGPGPGSQFAQPPPMQYGAAPPAAAAPPEPVQPNQSEMERASMLLQLLQMTDQQLAQLPPDQRQAVLMLREQIAGHV
ncbi:cleavage stimulation factor subunit 2-like [Paramacrobiotus metropolitanus]|uniref:cleavage stimulation factor subunit 2-like n=1 Tax=Paramacrobiotus metropolitanus TaxID=2943436 RepID=UPI0024461C5E|nr:cleavage stimulation factor subunit 2-like [Paramacrobiotus metropolitanus]